MPLRIISGLTHTARYSHTALQLQQGHIQGEDWSEWEERGGMANIL